MNIFKQAVCGLIVAVPMAVGFLAELITTGFKVGRHQAKLLK